MPILNEDQRQRALEVMREYLAAPPGADGKTWVENETTWDEKRVTLIEKELKPLLVGYLEGRMPLADFKSKVDGINKRNTLWGFRGVKGQMFFNMVVNNADDLDECDQELKAALAAPVNDQIASSRIKTFVSYVKRLGDQWVEAGNTRHGTPKVDSIPYFLSYFWQIQDRDIWPVYYTSSVKTMADLNLWQRTGDIAEDFLAFKRIHEELAALFTESSRRTFGLYDVEHVFWFKGGNPYGVAKADYGADLKADVQAGSGISAAAGETTRLPESYIPPIVAVLPRMACHEEALVEAAKRSGTTLDRAFEKGVDAAFTILGYETKLLGQGKGRVPDGHALANDESYAILWDAKVRSNGYSMGTDDRTIREYITRQSRELKRGRFFRNIYYLIISSKFSDDYDDAIRSIKMETDVNEVSLVEAEAVIAMIDLKLRAPLDITLGPDGLQRLFTFGGVLSSEMVREFLS